MALRWAEETDAVTGVDSGPIGETRKLALAELTDLTHCGSADGDALCRFFFSAAEAWERSGRPLWTFHAASQTLVEVWAGDDAERGLPGAEAARRRSDIERFAALPTVLGTCSYVMREKHGAERRPSSPPATSSVRPEDRPQVYYGIVGESPGIRLVFEKIAQAAEVRETVLVEGETGTGKELVARAIHAASGDPPNRFIAMNCAALPRDLAESELFGHRRGAFTGATTDHPGLVRAASGGTLFLDEVSELSLECQAKLLRVLQDRVVRALGEPREVQVDLRFVAASNRPLRKLVQEGRFRRDLFFRLQRMVIQLPPLRARPEDLPALVAHLVERWKRVYRWTGPKTFSADALARLREHDWPGNVRELENVVFAACMASPSAVVAAEHVTLDDGLEELDGRESGRASKAPSSLREAERVAIADALRAVEGNKALAARILGISRKQPYAKIKAYGLEVIG
jgi:DNA-binding NtrC family response regulator